MAEPPEHRPPVASGRTASRRDNRQETWPVLSWNRGKAALAPWPTPALRRGGRRLRSRQCPEYSENNAEILREQALLFYSSIITGIVQEIDITYAFRQ